MNNELNTRVSAYGLLLRDEKLLLCRLSEKVGMNPGCWTLPGGGLNFGEDPQDAVVREFKEETGLTITVKKLLAVDSLCDKMPDWPAMHCIRIIYSVQYLSGDLQYEKIGSTDMCAWHTQAQTQALSLVDLAKHGIALTFN